MSSAATRLRSWWRQRQSDRAAAWAKRDAEQRAAFLFDCKQQAKR